MRCMHCSCFLSNQWRQLSMAWFTMSVERGKGCLRGPHPDLAPCPPVMEVWCRSRIPVEGNFGQTYDSVNQSIRGLYGEFSATIDLKVGGRGTWKGGEGGAGGHRE